MTAPTELLDAEAMKKAAFAVFAKANENNLSRDKIESLWPSQHYTHWDGLAEAAVRAYLSAGPAPAVPDAVERAANILAQADGYQFVAQKHRDLASMGLAASHMPVGDDYVLVPKEPTEHILREMAGAARDFLTETGMYPRSKMVYRVMLAAARAGEDG